MAYMQTLKEEYIDPEIVKDYLTEIADIWQGGEDRQDDAELMSKIKDFVYNKTTDDAHFAFDHTEDELVMRKAKDLYVLTQQIAVKENSQDPAVVYRLVAQTINQNVQQNLRMRMQMVSGPFRQETSRGYQQKRDAQN